MNEAIFKAYDIRGIYPTDINEEDVYKIGRAYAQFLSQENSDKELTVVVAQDMRLSSPALTNQLIKALTDGGLNIIDIGLASTPTFYLAVGYFKVDGGIQVSASHNPKEYNGLKMVRARGVPISGATGIEEIKKLALANQFTLATTKGRVSKKEMVTPELIAELKKDLPLSTIKPLKVVVDPANGMGILDLPEILGHTAVTMIPLNFTLDGTFPAHEADPLKEKNLVQLQQAVLAQQADLGIAVDGDGDRIFFVDNLGQAVPQAIIRGIMAQIAIAEPPGATVRYDIRPGRIRPGRITKDMIEAVGGIAQVTRVGHSLIQEQMIMLDSVFSGESSGHFFYKTDYGSFEVPTWLILKFLLWLSEQNKTLATAVEPYKKYFNSGEINSLVTDAKAKIAEVAKQFSDGQISYLDGVTVEYPTWWFNLRSSNTEPALRLTLEATNEELMREKTEQLLKIIRS
ncbi:MAG: phosphomannomutase/phosphoglucomutase [Candidatus Komeilibacteria bacterium]|nr:phosphomannomutase/phosphoglucomutase [Candidatus Komeilibacteria bacterium]